MVREETHVFFCRVTEFVRAAKMRVLCMSEQLDDEQT
jgi:hypothetical protein